MEASKTMKKRGFTLIELLVVIAIIAILAAILFPVFVKAKEASQTSTCSSNLKSLTTACLLYADDNGGRFPHCYYVENGRWDPGNDYHLWFWLIPRYVAGANGETRGWNTFEGVKNRFQCPSCVPKRSVAYAMNMGMDTEIVGNIRVPTKTILLVDGGPDVPSPASQNATNFGVYCPDGYQRGGGTYPYYPQCCAARRHNNGANFTFADGHVRWSTSHDSFFVDAAGMHKWKKVPGNPL